MTELTRIRLPLIYMISLLLGGCVVALPTLNVPFQERVAVVAENPDSYTILIDGAPGVSIPVPPDGRVTVVFPVLPRECSTYFLGIKIRDRSVLARKILLIARGERVVKRLSVRQLRGMRTDRHGYHEVRLQ